MIGCQQHRFHIEGHITGMENGSQIMLFKFKGDTIFSVDTTTIKNGSFSFEGREFLEDIAILTSGNYPEKVKAMEVVLENGCIVVNMDSVYLATGTPLNDVYNAYKKKHADYLAKINLLIENGANPELMDNNSELKLLFDELNEYKKSVIVTNIKNPVGLRLFKNQINNISLKDSVFQAVLSQIDQKFRSDREIVKIIASRRIEQEKYEKKVLLVGKTFIDYDLITPERKMVKLSDYMGNSKFTIIEFWASWCAPCIAEVPRLNKLYGKYKNKGLKIISISLDDNINNWQRAIQHVDAPWIHLSDLKGKPSALTEAYCVDVIPRSLLLDENGIIIGINMSGQLLEEVLKKALGDEKKI